MLIVREFKSEDQEEIKNLIEEINNTDQNFEGLKIITHASNYELFLKELIINKYIGLINVPHIKQTTFGVFQNNKLIGGFNLRHNLDKNTINHGGHIGYLIRPSERNKGYGTKMLNLALQEAKKLKINKVLITCKINNKSSEKVILNNGGIYDGEYFEQLENETYKRYWINN